MRQDSSGNKLYAGIVAKESARGAFEEEGTQGDRGLWGSPRTTAMLRAVVVLVAVVDDSGGSGRCYKVPSLALVSLENKLARKLHRLQ